MINQTMNKKLTTQNQRGFAILFAVVGATLVLSIGLTIATITTKEVKLSAVSRDSQFAFYAADSGAECAEKYKDQFAKNNAIPATFTIRCGLEDVILDSSNVTQSGLTSATSAFKVQFGEGLGPNESKYCAQIEVMVSGDYFDENNGVTDGSDPTDIFFADEHLIRAHGYNVACDDLDNPRAIERGFEIQL